MNNLIQKSIRGSSAVQIAGSIEELITAGQLAAGDRLPTVRGLAAHLGVSPATVNAAFASLKNRGLLITGGRRGTRVSPRPPLSTGFVEALPEGVRDLALGNPDASLLPDVGPALARIDTSAHLYGEPLSHPELIALSRRSFASSGIPTDAITVTSGAMDGIERVLQAHLRPGDRVAVEDPGFTGVLHLLSAMGLVPIPVELDDTGPRPESVARVLADGVHAMIVTPRAQNPTGAALDEARAASLRKLFTKHPDVLLIEDDHAGGVAGAPVVSLCTKPPRHWAVIRSVSKAYGPDLRLGLTTGDTTTLARVEGRQLLGVRWVSFLLQRTVLALWKDPKVKRQLRRAEKTVSKRRRALVDALADRGIAAHGRSGFNVWVPVSEEGPVVQALRKAGWAVAAGERFRLESGPAIRITIATLEPHESTALADELARILAPSGLTLSS